MDRPIDQLEQLCREHGLKLTIQRRIVLEILEAATDHPCAREIHRRTAAERQVGIATVYRALNGLAAAGLVTRHVFKDGKARYERVGRATHPHLIDLGSGAIVEVDEDGLSELLAKAAQKMGYRLVDYRLKMFGVQGHALLDRGRPAVRKKIICRAGASAAGPAWRSPRLPR